MERLLRGDIMATITITIVDGKLNKVASDLEEIYTREAGLTDAQFITKILRENLIAARKAGKQKKVINNIQSDNDIS